MPATVHMNVKRELTSQMWWCKPLIPALGRQKQVDFYEFKASLVHRVSSRIQDSHGYTEKPCLEKKRKRQLAKGEQLAGVLSFGPQESNTGRSLDFVASPYLLSHLHGSSYSL